MVYRLKKQENAFGTYVLYDRDRLPVKCYPAEEGQEIVFYTELKPAKFLTKMMVPGFGGAYLFADNQGKGYETDGELLDFNLEAAKSRLYHLKEFAAKVEEEFTFCPAAQKEILEEAEKQLGGEVPGEEVLSILSRLLWAGEELVEFWSRNRIAKNGLRKDFMLGCSTKGLTDADDLWKERFSGLFNGVCIPTHWGILEPARGEKHYEVIDEMVEWAGVQHMNIRLHAVIWFCSLWEKQNWMGELPFEEVRALVRERVEFLMGRYGDRLDYVDFNEPMQSDGLNMTFDEHFSVVMDAYEIVKRHNPDCRIMINFFNEWQELYAIDRAGKMKDYYEMTGLQISENEWSVSVYQYIDRCIEAGMKIDCLGLQWHDHPYDLFGAYELIGQWSKRYRLPIQITELEVASGMGRPAYVCGTRPNPAPELYWHEPWSQRTQAEWFEKFMLLSYAVPEVEAFCVFGFCDAPTQWGSYVNGKGIAERFKVSACAFTGVLDENGEPKLSWYTLKRLAKQLGIQKR